MARAKSSTWMVCAWFASMSLIGASARAQTSEPPEDRSTRQADTKKSTWLHEIYLRDASEYDFSLDAESRQKLELRREPVMRWTSGGDYHGEVYVWTDRGRAAVVGCIFSRPLGDRGRQVMHEFHSLTPQPLFGGKKRGSGWQPEEAGITLEPIPDAPKPAENEARRLVQMRSIARRFSAQMMNRGAKWDLRLLPQPVYRYERTDPSSSVVDGAVFAFVWPVGTDPELLLVTEARRTGDDVRWYYAPAQFTNREVWVKDGEREVWRAAAATVGVFDGVTSKRHGVFNVKTIPNQETPQ